MPKGILTPSGRKRGPKPRKSVIFQDIEEKDLGFKDLPDYSSKNKIADISELQLPSDDDVEDEEPDVVADVENEAGAESDESDELACSICNSLTSKRGNQILLCDRCDFAVHQQCYMLPKVPEGEWLCQVCEAKREDLALEPVTALEEISSKLPDIRGFEHHLQTMQTFLLGRLTGECRMPLHGHDEEMEKLHQVVKQTVLAGEGNSMLVIGARGVGKTTLVDAVISDLSDHRDNFHVVRLNGFIHTDDKLALKDIWRQLGREMEIEDDSKATANDTLQSLLALLSHPSELAEIDEGHTTKSVVFILDEFDLFTTHPRQTLLYNLFDIAQARKAPIVVLGLTTRVDVAEALEKRVKSRFSHRYIHLSLPRSIPAFRDICKGSLTTSIEDLQAAGFDVELDGMSEFVAYWQTMIDDLCKEHVFKYHLETLFYKTKSTPEFLTSCILPVANLSTKNFPLKAKAFVASNTSLSAPDSKLHILQGLSELELALLISAARLDIILDTDTCNFAMVYDEYCSLTSRHKIHTSSSGMTALGAGVKVWGRDVALGAWERLADYDILVPAGVGGTSARDSGTVGRMWKADVALEEIAGSVSGLSFAMAKWCREI
ncbi:origin recognition complex subunit 4 C-terminus-domain-containing protein [Calycina marina]|uniref:Origin recognition complex subunit 4 n=1 Tax=Calycina marina TaxID=1763456 RepID=A0A9P7Z8F6_9HELO|nr:origin recognition complex subunit 4 C-terminus-domain-containing protein [Calycina marina]